MTEMMTPAAAARWITPFWRAQIDKYGNINSTVVGTTTSPRSLPGQRRRQRFRVFLLAHHDHDGPQQGAFREKCEFVTSPGSDRRRRAGRSGAAGGGPYKIVTDLAVMGFDEKTRQ